MIDTSILITPEYTPIVYTNNVDMQKEKVSQAVNNCPSYMAIPELLRNACQAPNVKNIHVLKRNFVITTNDPKIIEEAKKRGYKCDPLTIISTEHKIIVPKVSIRNDGDGIDDEKLLRITNLGQTEDKEFGKKASFGVGAKVAGLAHSPAGLVYLCQYDGSYHTVWLAGIKEPKNTFYGRIRNPDYSDSTGAPMDIWDGEGTVNALISSEKKSDEKINLLLDKNNWVEVILMGNHILEDTTKMIDRPKNQENWVVNNIIDRFFHIENKNCSIFVDNALLGNDDGNFSPLQTISEATNYENKSIVEIDGGIKVHYLHNPNKTPNFAGENSSFFAVIFKGEMYYVERSGNYQIGRKWVAYSANFGLNDVAREVSLLIELPDDFKVINDEYRTALLLDDPANEDKHQFDPKYFADLIAENHPEWVNNLCDSRLITDDEKSLNEYATQINKQIANEFRAMLQQNMGIESKNGKLLGVPTDEVAQMDDYRNSKSKTGKGKNSGSEGKPDEGAVLDLDSDSTDNVESTPPRVRGKRKAKDISEFEPIVLVTEADIESYGLTNDIARVDGNLIFINGITPNIDRIVDITINEHYYMIDNESAIAGLVKPIATRLFITQIVRYVYTSKSKSDNMNFRDLYSIVISPPAITNHVETTIGLLSVSAQRIIGAKHNSKIKELKQASKKYSKKDSKNLKAA